MPEKQSSIRSHCLISNGKKQVLSAYSRKKHRHFHAFLLRPCQPPIPPIARAASRIAAPSPCPAASRTPRPRPVVRSRSRAHRPRPVVRSRCHVPWSGPVAVGRDVPIAPPRRIARGGSPPRCAAWQVAHAESFACRGSVRGTVRGRAAHPARCHARAAIYPHTLPTRITRAARWGHRALPPLHPTIMRRYFAPTSMHHAAPRCRAPLR